MCKKLCLIFLALMISLSAAACGMTDSNMDIYEKIHKHYNKMEGYSADLSLTVFSNKTENRYYAAQKTISPDKFYTKVTDEEGTFSVTTVTNGGKTTVSADAFSHSMTVPSDEYLSLLFVNNFLSAYYASEDTVLSVSNSLAKPDKTVMEVFLPENKLSITKVSLSFDNRSLLPVSVALYSGDKMTAYGVYENFKYNDKIDQSVFNADN